MKELSSYKTRKDAKEIILDLSRHVLFIYALLQIAVMAYIAVNHLGFPLNLEAMELTKLQHVLRIMSGDFIYTDPSPQFVSFPYNPLYYYLSIPFVNAFGAQLFSLRLLSVFGYIGAALMIFFAVRTQTRSSWWGIVTVGVFLAAYRAMDTYLDMAHADSWLLFLILLGSFLIGQEDSRFLKISGVIALILSFWVKQHGALFAIGGVAYLTWKDGLKSSWVYWLLAGLLGPGLYLFGAHFFGPAFHFYTWEVPNRWGEYNLSGVIRLAKYTIKYYLLLASVGTIAAGYAFFMKRSKLNVWYFMLPAAILSALMSTFDAGNNNNVFIPMSTWVILTGMLGLHMLSREIPTLKSWHLEHVAIFISFGLILYNPLSVIVPPDVDETYQDFTTYLASLDGPVYAPWIGQLEDGYQFYPALHWVTLEDLIRGPGIDIRNHPTTRALLPDVVNPQGQAYILHNFPLEDDPLLNFLSDRYVLESDLGTRFDALGTLPRRFDVGYPRYLYHYQSPDG